MNEIFDYLKIVFNGNGFRLYMIGGTSRDYFLDREIDDYDFVTDAKPSEIATFLKVCFSICKTKYRLAAISFFACWEFPGPFLLNNL